MNSATVHENPSPSAGGPGQDPGAGAVEGFDALRAGAGVYDLDSRAKLSVSGRDRARWLNGMITNKVRDLAIGHGVYGFLLSPQGRILGDLYAYNRGEDFLLDSDQSQLAGLLAIFRRYIIMDKVEIANLEGTLSTIGLAGPGAAGVLRTAKFDLPELAALQVAEVIWKEIPMSIARSDSPALPAYEFWLPPQHVPALREALTQAGAFPVGASALELARIACGIPRYGQDIRERELPQETEQSRALHFSKGCYIGQEIVERIRSRGNVHRKFTGFRVQGPLPQPGGKIVANDKEVGEITSSAVLPGASGGDGVALGYIRREAAESGQELNVNDARITVAEVPFAGIFGAADVL